MKKIILFNIFCFATVISFAQKETFDIVSFTPPKNISGKEWKKETADNILAYTLINAQNNSWCRINIVKSTTSQGSIEKDFESEWNQLIVRNYKPTEAVQLDTIKETEGWKIKSGVTKFNFNNNEAIALLTTASGYNRCVSIVVTTNSEDYTKDIEGLLGSVELQKQISITDDNSKLILGTWSKSGSAYEVYGDPVSHGNAGYTKSQYSFHANGTYDFVAKTFRSSNEKILLIKETGTYQFSDNNLSINPEKSLIEAWTKKDGTDNYGTLVSTQNRKLEKVTYVITRHYFTGIQQWNLVFQTDKPTLRDGPFSNNKSYENAWYYVPISANNTAIELPAVK